MLYFSPCVCLFFVGVSFEFGKKSPIWLLPGYILFFQCKQLKPKKEHSKTERVLSKTRLPTDSVMALEQS